MSHPIPGHDYGENEYEAKIAAMSNDELFNKIRDDQFGDIKDSDKAENATVEFIINDPILSVIFDD